jgi:hypothetical protein
MTAQDPGGLTFNSPLSMVKHIIFGIGGQSGNALRRLSGRRNFPVYFCFGLPPLASLPLDCEWIYTSNRLLNQVNGMWQEWKSQETHLLGAVSVCVEFTEALSNARGCLHSIKPISPRELIPRLASKLNSMRLIWSVRID